MSEFEVGGRSLILNRYPEKAANETLQAWDSADEYLLQQSLPPGPILVFNDNFGALTCGLQPREVWHVSDSWISQQAAVHNLANNNFAVKPIKFLDSLAPLPQKPAAVLIKVPKTLALLEHQLQTVREVIDQDTPVIAAAKTKDIHNSTLALFEKILGKTHTSLAWKKARLIISQCDKQSYQPKTVLTHWQLENSSLQIANHANVFSRISLDPGARVFLQYLPENITGEVVDLGCGNGVMGLAAMTKNPEATFHFIDESWMAVASAKLNVETNYPQRLTQSKFTVTNCLTGITPGSLQTVLCNPPFHQQHAITDHIAWQMFRDAKRCLAYGGELRVVGNRHLDYHRKLKKLFGNCQLLGSDSKFVVLKAIKLG